MPAIFTSYDQLQASVERNYNRPVIRGFSQWLRQCENWIAFGFNFGEYGNVPPLRVREMEVDATLARVGETDEYTLPATYLDMRKVTGNYYQSQLALSYLEPNAFAESERIRRDRVYTTSGNKIVVGQEVGPPVKANFYAQIPALTEANYQGHLITELDDQVYLYGILAAAFHEIRNMDRFQSSLMMYLSTIRRLNSQAQRGREGDAPMRAVIVGGIP